MEQNLRFVKGQTYILGIGVNRDIEISIGRLGNISFSKGFYLYIGSAKNRLNARLKRHLSRDKKLFWHIDYLLTSSATCLKEIWIGRNGGECPTVRLISQSLNPVRKKSSGGKGLSNGVKNQIIRGFGSSDCRCPGHLVFIDKDISLAKFFKKQGFREIRFNYAG